MSGGIKHGLFSFFTFRIGGRLFAVNIANVAKIIEITDLTRVPGTPAFLKGIVNILGDVVPVFDGKLKFGFQAEKETRDSCILILAFNYGGQMENAGLIVDSVEKILNVESTQAVAESVVESEFVSGTVEIDGECVAILDLEKIFMDEKVINLPVYSGS